ncbi:A disintegrin and metalloproteinase with thrombospondin motifs 1 [Plakobranchus ocellatus]|uniref:A disintegrin and metalloproteinase with thrombospondin motifs 1 n=1 Tax=Plakobranchus ocellatus TaxID=259542 RepID=A0AAV3ZJL2_9GAST|nr:A disintegrin and metalloproteinase with thrombospondin motifs 1 [Plakobranchus ocellatus]
MYNYFQRFLILLFVCTLSQIPVESLEEEYLVDVRLLWEESDAGDRWKRDVDSGLPDHLSFAVPVQETDMKLRMRRSRLIPTATSHSPLSTIYVENAAVYTDPDKRAALIVKRDYDQYSLIGKYNKSSFVTSIISAGGKHYDYDSLWVEYKGESNATTEMTLWYTYIAEGIKIRFETIDKSVLDITTVVNFLRILTFTNLKPLPVSNLCQVVPRHNPRLGPVEVARSNRQPCGSRPKQSTTHLVRGALSKLDYVSRGHLLISANLVNRLSQLSKLSFPSTKLDSLANLAHQLNSSTYRLFHHQLVGNETDDDFIEVLINSGTFSGSTGLENFTTWYQDPANNISNADHYMYFTGFDISSASGIAYLGTTCTVYGVSLVENGFTAGTAVIASHELGHSTSCTEPGNTGSTDVLPAPTGSALAGVTDINSMRCFSTFVKPWRSLKIEEKIPGQIPPFRVPTPNTAHHLESAPSLSPCFLSHQARAGPALAAESLTCLYREAIAITPAPALSAGELEGKGLKSHEQYDHIFCT